MRNRANRASQQQGLTYLWVLLAVILLSLGIGRALEVYHQQLRREREAELLYIGEQYLKAIRAYYEASPGTLKRYPSKLDDLLLDHRLLTRRRYIRQLYPDPITGSNEWGLIRTRDGGIIGIYSLSDQKPIKRKGFPEQFADFLDAPSYRKWRFISESLRSSE